MPAKKIVRKVKLPSLSNLPKQIINTLAKLNIVYVLGGLLILASFLIGVLVTKVSYLENGVTSGTTTTVTGDDSGSPQVPTGPVDVKEGHLPILGDKDAKVTIVEFSDFQCPFCESLWKDTLPQIKKDYIDTGKAKFAYRHYPLDFHANAQKAAEASECANDQGKFWEFHDKLFETQTIWESLDAAKAKENFIASANTIGLNGAQLGECMDSGKFAEAVKEDLADGTTAGVQGTPATYINGLQISGAAPYEDFKTVIEQELAK